MISKLRFLLRGRKLAKAKTSVEEAKILAKESAKAKDLFGYAKHLKVINEAKAKAKEPFITWKKILSGGVIAGLSMPVGSYLSKTGEPPTVKNSELPKVPTPANVQHLKNLFGDDWDDLIHAYQEGRADTIKQLEIKRGFIVPEYFGFDPYDRKLNISLDEWVSMGGSTRSYAEAEERLAKGIVGVPAGDKMYYTSAAKPSFWDVITGKSEDVYEELSKPVDKKLSEYSETGSTVMKTINVFSYASIIMLVFILLTSTGVLKAR